MYHSRVYQLAGLLILMNTNKKNHKNAQMVPTAAPVHGSYLRLNSFFKWALFHIYLYALKNKTINQGKGK